MTAHWPMASCFHFSIQCHNWPASCDMKQPPSFLSKDDHLRQWGAIICSGSQSSEKGETRFELWFESKPLKFRGREDLRVSSRKWFPLLSLSLSCKGLFWNSAWCDSSFEAFLRLKARDTFPSSTTQPEFFQYIRDTYGQTGKGQRCSFLRLSKEGLGLRIHQQPAPGKGC